MLKYIINTKDLEDVLEVLYNVLDIGISFYDIHFQELSFFDKSRQAPYCQHLRKKNEFLGKCKQCDRKHFEAARKTGKIQVYRCHCGLFDGIVPLYDDADHFLGGIIFGQVRPKDQDSSHRSGSLPDKLYHKLPQASQKKMEEIGKLLEFVTETIVRQRIIALRNLGWPEKLKHYIESHIDQNLTVKFLAGQINRSPSFLSHHFKEEFGKSLAPYIKEKRMEIAMKLLISGYQVKETASKLGFYDEFHFSKVFKKHFGKSPIYFRANVQESDIRL